MGWWNKMARDWNAHNEALKEINPSERDWEYDGDGTKIYKVECGFGTKTEYDGGYLLWKKRFGGDWHDPPEYQKDEDGKFQGVKDPHYVDLP